MLAGKARLVNSTGRHGIADVFTANDATPAPDGGDADGALHVAWAALFNKGVTSDSGAPTTAATPRTWGT
jgi:hypothetical protein